MSNANQLLKPLEQIAGLSVVPDIAAPLTNFSMLFMKPKRSEAGVYVGTLHSRDHPDNHKPEGIGYTPYAIMRRRKPNTREVSQSAMDEIIEALQGPTHNNVYYKDGTKAE